VEARVSLVGDSLVIDMGLQLHVASSLHGLRRARYIVFHYVDEDFTVDDVDSLSRRLLAGLGLPVGDSLVFFTAVERGKHIGVRDGPVHVYATVGLKPPVCINYDSLYEPPLAGTINVLAVAYEPLSEPALIDLFRVVVEAKTLAASMLGLRCKGRAAGTVTDAIAVAAPVRPRGHRWAGMATRLGNRAARLVWRAVVAGDERSVEERLRGFLGVGLRELVEDAAKLYAEAPLGDPGGFEKIFAEKLAMVLRDPNVWSLIIAARELDLYGSSGLIPGVSEEEFNRDSGRIVADEVMGSMLALYLAGFKGLLATYWVDREKDRLGLHLSRLPVFEDDIAAALVGSILARIYDEASGQ